MKCEISSTETIVSKSEAKRYKISVLHKGLDVLEVVAFAGRELTLQNISDRVGQPKATVFRLLANLEERSYVKRTAQGAYYLGNRSRLLSGVPSQHYTLQNIALPPMQELRDRFGHTVSLAVRLANRILYIEMVEGTNSLRFIEPPGTTGPIPSTALGKTLLAWCDTATRQRIASEITYEALTVNSILGTAAFLKELECVKRRGYALDNEESVLGARCVAVPVFDSSGTLVAAISISGPAGALAKEAVAEISSALRHCSATVTSRLEEDAAMN